MPLSANTQAAAVGVSVQNVQFAPGTELVPHKILVVGTYLSSITNITDEHLYLVTSPEDAAVKFGDGTMIHRLVKSVWLGANGVETWVCPQAEVDGAAPAVGDIDFTGPATANGTIHLYISGDYVPINVSAGDTAAEIATAVAAKIQSMKSLPVSAAVNGTDDSQVDLTAKSRGPWGNNIPLKFNLGFQEYFPAGVSVVTVAMASGSGTPDIQDVLDALGTGDDSNEPHFTEVVHGYGQHAATLNALSSYNGPGNAAQGNYSKTVGKPFRSLVGDIGTGSAALATLVALGDSRKEYDRTNGVVACPGSPNSPDEIAAITLGIMARINNDRAAQNYNGEVLPNVWPGGPGSDRWTSEIDARNTAVLAGISPARVDGAVVRLTNVQTFYHPASVPAASNGYASMRNISILQNILYNLRLNFEQEQWRGISIVADVSKVTNSIEKQKARDTSAVTGDLISLAKIFEENAWLYTASFTIDRLKQGLVTVRAGGKGFNAEFPIILSGDATIIDIVAQFDTSLAAL